MKKAKRKRAFLVRIWALCLALCFAPICLPTSVARAEDGKVVKVGAFFYTGFLEAGGDGSYINYIFDYLREISRYTGWRYEFINATWPECFTMLEAGELDLLAPVGKMADRQEEYAFCDLPMMSGYGILATALDNGTLAYEDFGAFKGLRVGVLKNSLITEDFIRYSRKYGFTAELAYYDTQAEMAVDLWAGKLDAATMPSYFSFSGLRVIGRFGQGEYYFITGKENREVLSALNGAMEQIHLVNPYFNGELNAKYAAMQDLELLSFTKEEMDYIKNRGPLRCVYNPAARPISYYDGEMRSFQGIAADLCAELSEKTGLQFTFLHAGSYAEALELFTRQGAELLIGMDHISSWAQKHKAYLTASYMESQMMAVSKDGIPEKPTVALYERTQKSESMTRFLRTAERVVYYPSVIACLNAVKSGRADIALLNSTIVAYQRSKPEYAGLQATRLEGEPVSARIVVAADQDPVLVSILNKALANIPESRMEEIVADNMRTGAFSVLTTALKMSPLDLTLSSAGILLAVTFILMILFHNRAKSADAMRMMLYTDALTGYSSYKALSEAAPKLLGNEPGRYALLYIDMRQFKYINDTLGYGAGDEILLSISDILADFIAKDERFARVYADKFVLLLKSGEEAAFQRRLDDLARRLSHLRAGKFTDVKFVFRCGIYKLGEEDAISIDMACDRANYAKDMSKNNFETTFIYYDTLIRSHILDERWLEGNMQPALEKGEFIPYYQPKVNVVTGAVVGAEALVRWNHPERGLVPPSEFIPFFEKSGFVVHVDFAIFTAVCRTMREWMDTGKTLVPISVNFSRRHILDPDFADKIKAVADCYAIPHQLLEIEITETVALDDLDIAVKFIQSLKRYGFLLSIDDYGTGYSSLSFLQKLPLDILKLDKSFVDNAMRGKKARDIMWHLVTAVRDNGIRVLCEGIETEEQRAFIISQNCCFAQGYLYSRPVPQVEFERYKDKAGTAAHEYADYVSYNSYSQGPCSLPGDLMDRAMPGWVLSCLAEPGYPILYISPQMVAHLGYSEAELMNVTGGLYEACLHPDDLAWVSRELAACGDGQELHLEYRVRKKDGDYIWIRDTGKWIRTDDGRAALLCVCMDITDTVLLKQEKEDLLSLIPGGVCCLACEEEGPVVQCATAGFYTLIGRSAEEMQALGNRLFDLVHPSDLSYAKQVLNRVIGDRAPFCQCVLRIQNAADRVRWLSFRGAVRYTGQGQFITATCCDIDAKMQNHESIELVNTRLELALILTEHAMFEYDLAAKSIYAESGLEALFPFGIARDNVPDSLVESGMIHPEDVPAFLEKYRRIAEGEPYATCEVRMRNTKMGEGSGYSWIRTTFSAIYDESGRSVRAVGILEKIDREKRMEQAFAREGQYREALTASALLSYDVDLMQDSVAHLAGSFNPHTLGVSGEDAGSQRYSNLLQTAAHSWIAAEDRGRFLRDMDVGHLRKLHQDGIAEQEYEYRRLLPDGTFAWIAAFVHFMPCKEEENPICIVYYRDIQARKSVEERLKYRATRDALTGLLNRDAGERRIQAFLAGEGAEGGTHAFVMLDMDNFKKINDTFGHHYGDTYLANMAKAIAQTRPAGDIVTRIGGDEFVVLAKDLAGEGEALDIAAQIGEAIASCGRDIDISFKTTASIGVALAPRDGADFATLYRRADEAMYAAKRSGGNGAMLAGYAHTLGGHPEGQNLTCGA